MPRRARLILPNSPLHIVQRGHNRQPCFFADDDYRYFLYWLKKYAENYHADVHAYVVMTNHIHLLLSSADPSSPSGFMKALAQRYTQYVNWTYARCGTLWQGRYYSCLVQNDDYLLACYRYIESNPVRAGMVAHPSAYRWSSYRANAHGEADGVLKPHSCYEGLAQDADKRQAAYRALFDAELDDDQLALLRKATRANAVYGNDCFVEQVENALARRIVPGKRGRPIR
jgi:putative transposase